MVNKKNIYFQCFNLLENKTKYFYFFIIIASIFVSFLELVGIGFLGSFIMFLTDIQGALEIITKYKFFYFLLDIDEASLINFLLFSIIIFFIIKNIILFLYFYFFNKFNASLNYEISKKIFLNIMNNNYEYYLNQKKSKIIHAITEESKRFSGVFFSILNLIKDGFLILFLATSIFLINWKISIIMFLMFLFFSIKLLKTYSAT